MGEQFQRGLSQSRDVRRLSGDVFSSVNLERTLQDLNETEFAKRAFGGYEADGDARQSAVLIPLCLHNVRR